MSAGHALMQLADDAVNVQAACASEPVCLRKLPGPAQQLEPCSYTASTEHMYLQNSKETPLCGGKRLASQHFEQVAKVIAAVKRDPANLHMKFVLSRPDSTPHRSETQVTKQRSKAARSSSSCSSAALLPRGRKRMHLIIQNDA